MITDAQGFFRDITADLVPGKKSLLEQAVPDDVSDGRILISVESLDRWARKKYKFSIRTGRLLGSKPLFCDDSAEADDYGPLKAKNMMVTLALMVDLYVKIGSPYTKSSSPGIDGDEDNDTNASFNAIAEVISHQATLRCKPGYDEAQGTQTIRKLLKVASDELRPRLK